MELEPGGSGGEAPTPALPQSLCFAGGSRGAQYRRRARGAGAALPSAHGRGRSERL